MQRIKKFLFFSLVTCATGLANAEVYCPPTDIITQLQFIKADGYAGIWDLFSTSFNYDKKTWQVIFTVYLPNANTNDEAIELGSYYFKTNVVFFDPPIGRNNGDSPICYYAQADSSYFVRAMWGQTPQGSDPSLHYR